MHVDVQDDYELRCHTQQCLMSGFMFILHIHMHVSMTSNCNEYVDPYVADRVSRRVIVG